jgi:type VI secretion system secreted protein Hcp
MNSTQKISASNGSLAIKKLARAAVLIIFAAFAVCPIRAQTDVFMQLTDDDGNVVPAENQVEGFPGDQGWFGLDAYNIGIANTITFQTAAGAGAQVGKAHFTDLTVTKKVDKTSPILFKTAASGSHFQKVKIVIRKSSADAISSEGYLTYELGEVYVSKVQWSGSGGDFPQENITLNFASLKVSYRPQDTKGQLLDPITATFNQLLNKGG